MTAADLGEIVEADHQPQFARLQLFAAQLANQPRGLAKRERERRLIIRFVLGRVVALEIVVRSWTLRMSGSFTSRWQTARAAAPRCRIFLEQMRRKPGRVSERARPTPPGRAPPGGDARKSRSGRSRKNSFSSPGLTSKNRACPHPWRAWPGARNCQGRRRPAGRLHAARARRSAT